MTAAEQERLYGLLERIPQAAAVVAVSIGILVLTGWIFGVNLLKSGLPGLAAMKVNTAVAIILSGLALFGAVTAGRGPRVFSRLCAGAVLLLAGLTLAEDLSGADFGIDQWLIRETSTFAGDIPGRAPLNAALSLTAIGAALLLLNGKKGGRAWAVNGLATVPLAIAGAKLLAYSFGFEAFLRQELDFTPMALPAAAALVVLALGIVNARPGYPLRRLLTSRGTAGVIARYLLPAAVAVILLTGWLMVQGYQAGLLRAGLQPAALIVVNAIGAAILILWAAGRLFDMDLQRDRLEQTLRENEEQLNAVLKLVPVGLWMLDAKGNVIFGNEAAHRIWAGVRFVGVEQLGEYKGWRRDTGRRVSAHEWAGVRAVEKGETVVEDEIEIECFDGTHKIILDSAVPLRRSDGSIRGAVTVNQDITRRTQAETALRDSEKKLRAMTDSSPLAIFRSTGIEQKADYVNPTFTRLFGYTLEDVPTLAAWAQRAYPDEAYRNRLVEEWQNRVTRAIEMHTAIEPMESIVTCKDGTTKNMLWGFISTGVQDWSFGTDLTERKRAEEELRHYHEHLEALVRERTSELEQSNRDLEEFVYSLSHDLRVPLRAVDGYSSLLRSRCEDRLDDEGRRLLKVVRINTGRMERHIDAILAYSRMGLKALSLTEVDMDGLARRVLDELKPNLAGRSVRMDIRPLPPCRGDVEMLREVWANLLSNAIKFTARRADAMIEAGGRTESTETVYYVRDNGAGFDMQYAGKLFGVFQRLHGVEEFEGAGIGLAIVKRIITRHGGRVWAEGRVGQGATFFFSLPMKGEAHD
ncbi:MAG TPA: ATP-binding protein [Gallionella sp.]|nr:ATP-binding protein [Gallionella sp.]